MLRREAYCGPAQQTLSGNALSAFPMTIMTIGTQKRKVFRPRSADGSRPPAKAALRRQPAIGWRIPRWLILCPFLAAISGTAAHAQTAPDSDARQAMQQGAAAMAGGNFRAAVAAYSAVTHQLPDFAEGYFNLGLAMEQDGSLDDARAALEKALRLKPGLRGANLFLGIVDYRENRFRDAEASLLRETQIDPQDAKAFMWLGVCKLAQDDPQGAIAPLDKAFALDPKDADILYHRGRAYLLVANASYDAMFKLDHDSMRVHQVLAEAYAQGYRNQDAITEFQLAVKMAPQQPGLHEELADQFWIVGQLDQAADAYRQELVVDPQAESAQYKLGSLLVLNRNVAEGVELLRAVLRDDPALSDAHYYLGRGLLSLDKDQEAIQQFELAVAADPSNDRAMSAYYQLAQAYRGLHDTQNAETAMKEFLRMRAQVKERQDQHAAQIARKRTELPVDDPERVAMVSEPAGQ
jgi:tetratricopeptide (TPR) repeat protein